MERRQRRHNHACEVTRDHEDRKRHFKTRDGGSGLSQFCEVTGVDGAAAAHDGRHGEV
jgi:hypothetical protein